MENIEFQNKIFKVREIELPEFGNVIISTNSLNEILLNSGIYSSEEARSVDEKIFFFVEDNEIELTDEELIKVLNLELR
jgi:hypothetical protein